MIAYLEGLLAEKSPTRVTIDVNGVGYRAFIPLSTFDSLPKCGQKMKLLTHTHVREDALTLFGFLTAAEKDLFELLLNVNGVGPKSALGILSSISVTEFRNSILSENVDALTRLSGVGKKTAQRLVVELKEKISKTDGMPFAVAESPGSSSEIEQAMQALVSLGLDRTEARNALQGVNDSGKPMSVENLVKNALSKGFERKVSKT
ncbi:MAG: Holliday junction branch migration protein RuvA [candidate division Zixibacteria bacterium]|nr:Holliday junction branch migration protein RuvA [candidate division Zixibacteria bacterium]